MAIKVNDQVIPSWAIERQAQSLYEQVARGMQGKPQEVIQLAAIDLAKERMIDQSLMAQESNRRKYQIDPEEVNKGMKRWMRENGGKKAIEKAKHPAIKDRDDLRREILAQLRYNRLLEEESSCDIPTEEEAREYYDNRPDLFTSEEMVSASHILKKASSDEEFENAEKEILSIRDRLLGGEDFVKCVQEESDDGGNDGNLGTFGKGRMVPEFEEAAFSLEPDQLSEPVKTQFGWHVIKLHEKHEPKLTPFDELKEKIIEYLHERKKDKVFDSFLDELKAKATIEEVSGI
ncbi:MAG: peptidylprolyl isomerase [Opitutales bacterium]|jgi:parvulin-like peptidyl-prolyl isomerase|nr:peptidylprolyl isomerase [Opitutales bacterium]